MSKIARVILVKNLKKVSISILICEISIQMVWLTKMKYSIGSSLPKKLGKSSQVAKKFYKGWTNRAQNGFCYLKYADPKLEPNHWVPMWNDRKSRRWVGIFKKKYPICEHWKEMKLILIVSPQKTFGLVNWRVQNMKFRKVYTVWGHLRSS